MAHQANTSTPSVGVYTMPHGALVAEAAAPPPTFSNRAKTWFPSVRN